MKEISSNELKKIELRLLKEIDKVCRAQHIYYSLDGGTLLGAIRHNGFIPWDDDIDILMTRENYDRFIDYCKKNKTSFSLLSSETNDKYGYLFAKVMDMSTILQEHVGNRNNIEMGVCIDIFPVDYLGNSFKEAKKNMRKTSFLRELLVARNWKTFKRSKTKSIIFEPIRFLLFILSRFANEKKLIYKIKRKNEIFSKTFKTYSGCICGSYRYKEIVKTSTYKDYALHRFEDSDFYIVCEYDYYLSSLFGDYMKLPPKEKQITHHSFNAFYK